MSSDPPFVVPETAELDTTQIRQEAYPIAGLIALFGGLALIPLLYVFLVGGSSPISFLFMLVAQFILAIGAAIILMYVIARGIQLANEDGTGTETGPGTDPGT